MDIDEAGKYVYLGKTVTRDGDLRPKIKRRTALGWAAFSKVYNIMRSRKASMKIKELFSLSVCSRCTLTHGREIWALEAAQMDTLAVAQRQMERIVLGIALRDRKRNTWIRLQTEVTYIIDAIKRLKHR